METTLKPYKLLPNPESEGTPLDRPVPPSFNRRHVAAYAPIRSTETTRKLFSPDTYPVGDQQNSQHSTLPVSSTDQNPPSKFLHVRNLPEDVEDVLEMDLRSLFSRQRGFKRLYFTTTYNKPICLVEFENTLFATAALKELHGLRLRNSFRDGIQLSLCEHSGSHEKLTVMLWEDEGTICFQVEHDGICVARREDNHMINGTKLLNVARMTRGRRDGILQQEKIKKVVKIAPMHLKGVWIPFDRALELANRESIADSLHPLFVTDVFSYLRGPSRNVHGGNPIIARELSASPMGVLQPLSYEPDESVWKPGPSSMLYHRRGDSAYASWEESKNPVPSKDYFRPTGELRSARDDGDNYSEHDKNQIDELTITSHAHVANSGSSFRGSDRYDGLATPPESGRTKFPKFETRPHLPMIQDARQREANDSESKKEASTIILSFSKERAAEAKAKQHDITAASISNMFTSIPLDTKARRLSDSVRPTVDKSSIAEIANPGHSHEASKNLSPVIHHNFISDQLAECTESYDTHREQDTRDDRPDSGLKNPRTVEHTRSPESQHYSFCPHASRSPETISSMNLYQEDVDKLSCKDDYEYECGAENKTNDESEAKDEDEDEDKYVDFESSACDRLPAPWGLFMCSNDSTQKGNEERLLGRKSERSNYLNDADSQFIYGWLSFVIDQYVVNLTSQVLSCSTANIRDCKGNNESKDAAAPENRSSENAKAEKCSSQRANKRAREGNDEGRAPDEDDDAGENRRRRKGKGPKSSAAVSRNLFACFFHKRNPRQYCKSTCDSWKTCPTGYETVHRLLSDHCRRLHMAPLHCPRCKKEDFDAEQQLDEHLLSKFACEFNEEKTIEGIACWHKRAWTEGIRNCKSEEEKWVFIYKVLFPGEEVPSPYIDECYTRSPGDQEIGQKVAQFVKDYRTNDLPNFLNQFPRSASHNVPSYIYTAVKEIAEDFLKKFHTKFVQQLSESRGPSLTFQPDHNQDDSSSNTDRGRDSRAATPALTSISTPGRTLQGSDVEGMPRLSGQFSGSMCPEQQVDFTPYNNCINSCEYGSFDDEYAKTGSASGAMPLAAVLQDPMFDFELPVVPDPITMLAQYTYMQDFLSEGSQPYNGNPINRPRSHINQTQMPYKQYLNDSQANDQAFEKRTFDEASFDE